MGGKSELTAASSMRSRSRFPVTPGLDSVQFQVSNELSSAGNGAKTTLAETLKVCDLAPEKLTARVQGLTSCLWLGQVFKQRRPLPWCVSDRLIHVMHCVFVAWRAPNRAS